jgi:ubiquinone/menaquinone biosynthesis C-methylase UbiE
VIQDDILHGRRIGHDLLVSRRIDPEGAETAALAKLVELEGLCVLELGCGNGRLTFRYAQRAQRVLAIDPDHECIAEARATTPPELRDTVEFLVSKAEDVDAPRSSFDVALFSSSL